MCWVLFRYIGLTYFIYSSIWNGNKDEIDCIWRAKASNHMQLTTRFWLGFGNTTYNSYWNILTVYYYYCCCCYIYYCRMGGTISLEEVVWIYSLRDTHDPSKNLVSRHANCWLLLVWSSGPGSVQPVTVLTERELWARAARVIEMKKWGLTYFTGSYVQ